MFLVKHYRPHPWLESLTPEQLKRASVWVVKMQHYRPNAFWSEQKFNQPYHWHAPSPNLPNFGSCFAYGCMIPMRIYGNVEMLLASERESESGEAQPFRFFHMYHKDDDVKPIVSVSMRKNLRELSLKRLKTVKPTGLF